jgi:hypothetical protein
MILKQVNAIYVICKNPKVYHKFLEINDFDMDEYQFTRDVFDLISIDKCEIILLYDWDQREDYQVIRRQLVLLYKLRRVKVVFRSCLHRIGRILDVGAQREYDQACTEEEDGQLV